METFIPAEEIFFRIKKYRESLTYDEQFDFEMETSKLLMGKKGKERFEKNLRAPEYRKKRYGEKYDALRNKKLAA
jgi:hypothetical protein